jgi:integrase
MAITEYQKMGKTVFKVYVQCRGKTVKRIRLQKVLYDVESLAVAKREEKRLLKEILERLAKLEGKGLLWSEVIYRWEVSSKNNAANSRLNRFTILDHVNRLVTYTDLWLGKSASELTRADGRQVLNSALTNGTSKSLLNKIKGSINLVYGWGLEEGLIQTNFLSAKSPVFGLEFGCKEEKIKPILTLDEVRRFLFEAKIRNHPWYPIWAFAVTTGMRSSELYALDWGDIDDKNGIIRVSKSFCKRSKSVKCPKNGLWRNVDISPQLDELIQELRVVRGNEKSVLPNFPVWKNGDAPKVLRLFLDDIGLTKQIVFHTLRACFATHLLGMGVDASKVMRMGGWSDLKTFQIYLRLAGVDVKGITAGYDVLPGADAFQNVVPLFSQ